MTAWFERFPERLVYELQALREKGFTPNIDEVARTRGQLVLSIPCPINGAEHVLRVQFPRTYPYFPFQVFAPSLSLGRHQHPYSKALCFIARIETEWRTDDTVAMYLVEKLPEILKANDSEGPFAGEGREGAPVTLYLPFDLESVVLVGDWTIPSSAAKGTLLLGVERNLQHGNLRAAVREVKDERGSVLGKLEKRVLECFDKELVGRWVRLPARPQSSDPNSILSDVAQVWPAVRTPNFHGGDLDVTGIVFPDEVRYRELRDVWIFLLRRKAGRFPAPGHGQRGAPRQALYLVRADRVGRSDLLARVPRLAPIVARKAAVFGLGALGSTVAWQLARAGVGKLALADYDFVNAATTPRWLLGVPAAGRIKPNVLAEHLRQQCPYLDVDPIILRVGDPFFDPDADVLLGKCLDETDLVVDCTVEKTVQHFLSSTAWERGIPYVWASATPGAWGGIVGRILPDRPRGCWSCFRGHLADGTIREPQGEEGPDIQPDGCDVPTFRGAGFDLDEVALMCARLGVSTICRSDPDAYGDFTWDVATVDLRQDGKPVPPIWTTYELRPHRDCGEHE